MLYIEKLDSQIFILFKYVFHVISFVVDGSKVSTGLGFVFELKIDTTELKKELKTFRSVPDGAEMDACETFDGLLVDILMVIFGVLKVGCFENIV